MRVTGSERRPPASDAAIFLIALLLLPLPVPLPSAARALSPSTRPPPLPSAPSHRKAPLPPIPAHGSRPSPRVVHTEEGALRGIVLELKGLGASVSQSRVAGDTRSHSQQGSIPPLDPVEAFWGVRYAEAPVGEYRFAPPHPVNKWEGTKEADSFAPVCPQKFPVDFTNRTAALAFMPRGRYLRLRRALPLLTNQSEDCLFLNVYVPGGGLMAKKSSSYAVMFYVHGESYEWNSGNHYDGSVIASLGHVIVVTINFRLGALGFMQTGPAKTDASSDPTTIQGNWGLVDVLEALRWVRRNVESFGGDKDRVTVVGHHTGAALVHLLLVSTAAKGLFQRAVMLSGSAQSLWAIVREPRALRRKVAERLGCLTPTQPHPAYRSNDPGNPTSPPPAPQGEDVDVAPCLRKASLGALLSSYPTSMRFLARFAPALREDDSGPWLESGGGVAPAPGAPFVRIPLMLGVATAEAYSELSAEDVRWGLEEERRDALLRTFVANSFYFHRREILAAVKNEYTDWVGLGGDPRARGARSAKFGDGQPTSVAPLAPARHHLHPITVRDATVEALGDGQTVAPVVSVTRSHAGSAPTYFLHFSHHARDGVDYAQERLGSAPEEIVFHLFGSPVLGGLSPSLLLSSTSPPEVLLNYTRQDVSVAIAMIRYFSNFAKSGDPNWESQATREAARSEPWPSGRNLESTGHIPMWLPFDLTSQMHLNMGPKAKMRSHYRSHKMALWLNLIPQLHRSQDEDQTSSHHEFSEKESHYYAGPVLNKSIVDPYWRMGALWSKSALHTATLSSSFDCDPPPDGLPTLSNPSPRNSSHAEEEEGGGGGRDGQEDYMAALSITVTLGVVLLLLNAAVLVAGVVHHYRHRTTHRKKRGKKEETNSEQGHSDHHHVRFLEGVAKKDFVSDVSTELGLVSYPDVMGHGQQKTFKGDNVEGSSDDGKSAPLDLPFSVTCVGKSSLKRKGSSDVKHEKDPKESYPTATVGVKKRVQIQEISV